MSNRAPSWTPRFLDVIVTDKLFNEVERFVRGVRDDGTVVVEGVIRLWVTPRR